MILHEKVARHDFVYGNFCLELLGFMPLSQMLDLRAFGNMILRYVQSHQWWCYTVASPCQLMPTRLAKAARYSCQECKSKALVHADHSTYYCYRLHIPFCHVAGGYIGGTSHTNSTGVCGISLSRFIAWRDWIHSFIRPFLCMATTSTQ